MFYVISNITEERRTRGYETEESANRICRQLNISAGPGGLYGVREEAGHVMDLTDDEFTLIMHVRGETHHGPTCAVCRVERSAWDARKRLDSVIAGSAS